MLFHNSIRKYTLALLSTFNDLKVETKLSDDTYQTKTVPIKYASREKATLFDEATTQQLLSGNYNVLPRASLAMSTMVKSAERTTNKHLKLGFLETGDIAEFMYNAVSYEFTFELTLQCRGMNEASMLIEQITTRFNPNYTLRINEVPNQTEPTSIPVSILDIAIEASEYEEISSNIVTVSVGLAMKGNFYPPVKTMPKIKNVDMFINMWHTSNDNDYNRATLFEYDVTDSITSVENKTNLIQDGYASIVPTITSINSFDTVAVGEDIDLEVLFNDADNKLEDGYIYVWNVTGSSTITTGSKTVTLTGVATEIVQVSIIITDYNGNSSNIFTKDITVT